MRASLTTPPHFGRTACRHLDAALPSPPLRPTNQARSRTTTTPGTRAARALSSFNTPAHLHRRQVASPASPLYTPVPAAAHPFPAFTRSFSARPRHFDKTQCNSSQNTSHFANPYRTTRSAVGSWTSLLIVGAITGSAYIYHAATKKTSKSVEDENEDHLIDPIDDYIYAEYFKMTGELLPGRPGTLTPEEDLKLREFWIEVLKVFGVIDQEQARALKTTITGISRKSTTQSVETTKKKKHGWFSRSHDSDEGVKAGQSAAEGDKYGQTAQFKHALANMSPETLRTAFWSMVKHDHPDGLLLRFLRARKWDVEKALVMMVSTMHWRAEEMHIDDDIMINGEEHMLENSCSTDQEQKHWGSDFLNQMRMGKSYLHGSDLAGRPVCFIRVRLHHAGDQGLAAQERFTVYLIETSRLLLNPPVDTACIMFDMTDFGLSNMDYVPVKFIIKAFEANYPECLGVVLIHRAPWIFNAFWRIIRGLLDPVVAAKVHFTYTAADLAAFIDLKKLPKEHGGEEDFSYQYLEPVKGENAIMADEETRQKLLDERTAIVDDYEKKTIAWIENGADEELKKQRQECRDKLKISYWQLDPYVRARSHYDRSKNLLPGGSIDWFQGEKMHEGVPEELVKVPTAAAANGDGKVNGKATANGHAGSTSVQDLD